MHTLQHLIPGGKLEGLDTFLLPFLVLLLLFLLCNSNVRQHRERLICKDFPNEAMCLRLPSDVISLNWRLRLQKKIADNDGDL